MLYCKDFVPTLVRQQAAKVGLFSYSPEIVECEDFSFAVLEAGKWLRSGGVRLVQVETVVLPNLWQEGEEGSQDTSIRTSTGQHGGRAYWHQFVRVWYTTDKEPPLPR